MRIYDYALSNGVESWCFEWIWYLFDEYHRLSHYLMISGKEACSQLMHDPKINSQSTSHQGSPAGQQCSRVNANEVVRRRRRHGRR